MVLIIYHEDTTQIYKMFCCSHIRITQRLAFRLVYAYKNLTVWHVYPSLQNIKMLFKIYC